MLYLFIYRSVEKQRQSEKYKNKIILTLICNEYFIGNKKKSKKKKESFLFVSSWQFNWLVSLGWLFHMLISLITLKSGCMRTSFNYQNKHVQCRHYQFNYSNHNWSVQNQLWFDMHRYNDMLEHVFWISDVIWSISHNNNNKKKRKSAKTKKNPKL